MHVDVTVGQCLMVFPPFFPAGQVMHSSKVYLKLNERLGLSDHSTVLNIMLRWVLCCEDLNVARIVLAALCCKMKHA